MKLWFGLLGAVMMIAFLASFVIKVKEPAMMVVVADRRRDDGHRPLAGAQRSGYMTPPEAPAAPPPQGGAIYGPAEPDPWWPLDWLRWCS